MADRDFEPDIAVWARNLNKSYGKGKNKLSVLNNLQMTVHRGAIYGLLGPSGCGKTTLLRCIVGRLSVDKGHLLVLSEKPGWPGHGVPGRLVGYMPQEMALFNDMTIGETLKYFGQIHGMPSVYIGQRTEFLLQFLSLPKKERLISELSGGQKRRVSFAVALLHEPELLILDEPTVGVDPILRERIWEHLISIASQGGSETTIIITTHYIEEARKADMVGLMRNGRLLAEATPKSLIEKYHINSLEAIFLKLCHTDKLYGEDVETVESNTIVHRITTQSLQAYDQGETTPLLAENSLHSCTDGSIDNGNNHPVHVLHTCRCPCGLPAPKNIFAQVVKNLTLMKRNIGFLLFEFILPSIQIILFCLCIGRDPYDLQVAIVNNETIGFGKLFINSLDNETINKIHYSDMNSAIQCVKAGDCWGVIGVGKNFSQDLIQRFTNATGVSNQTLDGSSVKLYLDMTNQQISVILQEKILTGFQYFAEKLLHEVHLNPGLANLPIVIEDPIYGSKNPSFTNFMAPGIILSITFFLATGLTTLSFVMEKKEGLLDRSLVAGMTTFEIMLAHVCTQFLVMVVQVALLLIFALLVFHVPYKGPLIWVIILVLLQGFCGMTLGVIFSAVCENESSAIQLALGSVYPMLLLSGIIWPIQAEPEWMRYISVCLPMTYASEAMRCILSKGWGIEYLAVWRGYLVTIGWSFGLLAIAGFILRVKQ